MSFCLTEITNFDKALLILKKSIQYAWFFKDEDFQYKIADLIAKNYFLMGDMESGRIYQEK